MSDERTTYEEMIGEFAEHVPFTRSRYGNLPCVPAYGLRQMPEGHLMVAASDVGNDFDHVFIFEPGTEPGRATETAKRMIFAPYN